MTATPVYNHIGRDYNTTRRADKFITDKIYNLLAPEKDKLYIDIGCGTGNYLKALSERGVNFIGIDPSEIMLERARSTNPDIQFICSKAEYITLPDNSFDGGMALFTLHHWDNIQEGIDQIYRVVKPAGRFIFFSFTPEQLNQYWLHYYFPEMIKVSGEVIPTEEEMRKILNNAGFKTVETEKYFIHDGLTDMFLYANKRNPAAYLDPKVRAGASSFRIYSIAEEVESGLVKLEEDINSGKINAVMNNYSDELGDYLFYIVEK